MVALTVKSNCIRLCVLIAMLLGPTSYNIMQAQAQAQESRKVIITTKKVDKQGNTRVEKMELTGEDASEEAIEKLLKKAKKDGKSIDVEMEYTFDTDGKEMKDLLKEHGLEGEKGDIEVEIEIDEDGNMNKTVRKSKKKEVRIIKTTDSEEDIDIDALLKEHDISLDEGGTKEIKIIKIKGDKDTDIEELLKEHGIDKDGQDQEVRIIEMKGDKKAKKGAMTRTKTIKIEGDKVIELEEKDTGNQNDQVQIFQDENGKTTIIKTESREVIKWTEREDVEENLKNLGITLPTPSAPIANYVNAVTTSDNLVFLAGKGPKKEDGTYITGKVGKDLSVKEGYAAARRSGIIQLGALKAAIGDLNRVKRIVKVLGMVNSTADFTDHPEVINGFSDLMVEVFGERGKHARAAVGMYSLPRNIAVEIEMIVEIE